MFDSLSDLEKDLSELIKDKNITIININNNKEVNLELKVFSRNDNLVNFQLNKVELNENEKIDNLIKDISKIKEEYQKFKNDYINENKKLKEELYNKDIRISELEKKIEKILIDLEKGKKISDDGDIKLNSNIINDKNELQFLLKSISFNENIYLKLLYDSNIEGENENKLIDAYTEKNDIIILVKTKNNQRFGGYAHECFEKGKFHKIDSKAFLFSLDKLKIYQSNKKN